MNINSNSEIKEFWAPALNELEVFVKNFGGSKKLSLKAYSASVELNDFILYLAYQAHEKTFSCALYINCGKLFISVGTRGSIIVGVVC